MKLNRRAGQPKCEARFVVTATGREHKCQCPAKVVLGGKRYCRSCAKAAPRPAVRFECRCGCSFDVSLGKYGCPSCAGDRGQARLVEVRE